MNSGRPIGVVQEGSSNSDHEQCRQTVAMNSGREQWSSNRGRPRGVVKQ